MSSLTSLATCETPNTSLIPLIASIPQSKFSVMRSTQPNARGDHLRVGSIALFCQNPTRKSIIRCKREDHCDGLRLHFGGLSHAVLILSRSKNDSVNDKEETCLVAWVTSHGHASLASYVKNYEQSSSMQRSIPIEHYEDANCVQILRLLRGKLNKQSYVMVDHAFEIPVSMLRSYVSCVGKARAFRLQESSYITLMQSFGMAAQDYRPQPYRHFQSFASPPLAIGEQEDDKPHIRYALSINITETYANSHTYSGSRSATVVPPRRAESSYYSYQTSEFVSFPALPPSPNQSPCRGECKSPGSRLGMMLDENSPLLPAPATYRPREHVRFGERVGTWLTLLFAVLTLGLIIFFWIVVEEFGVWSGDGDVVVGATMRR
ncbi:uncharacterized protein LY89DRAFT_790408 [Mollisia scopiformis]|uniref:Uncharacterized protein n=1 Tax=Mollisia scopiformis TaxID=149040 RepID=A0A132B2C5_MOLSC|nr:uncharacterized protein LY89DRAFT_790408 [Mollisia scopiformis]KUJ06540.1 hypothetical protein LY89DRAFT_790408 [Mollisia scopiformis]